MNKDDKQLLTRRRLLQSGLALGLMGCVKKPKFCDEPSIAQDGDFRTADSEDCVPTASNIEGPFYSLNAPERKDFRQWGDEGVEVTISGRVVNGDCTVPLSGAIVEFWHADPNGDYDNESEQMRYRGAIRVDQSGTYQLETLLPGRYLNGTQYRPHHIHVKVWDADGNERLTTQLYFEGDEYLDCDGFGNTSLIMPFEGTLDSELVATNIDFIV